MERSDNKNEFHAPGSRSSIVMFVLLFIGILAIAAFVYIKSQNIDLKNLNFQHLISESLPLNSKNNPTVVSRFEYDLNEHPVFKVYKGSILKCTKDGIAWLNQKGERQQIRPVTVVNPFLKGAGSYVLVAETRGKELCILRDKGILWSKKMDGIIINADISSTGYVSVVKEKKGYKGAIDVYDPEGNWIFTSVRGESNVLSANVLSSRDKVLVNMVNTSGITVDAGLAFTDLQGKNLKEVSMEDTIFPTLWELGDDSLAAVSENQVVSYDKNLEVRWTRKFDHIYASRIVLGKYIVVSTSDDKGKFSIVILNGKGQDAAAYSIDSRVKSIDCNSSVIALNTGGEVHFINTKGNLMGVYAAKGDISGVDFFNKEEAAIITKNEITTIKIN